MPTFYSTSRGALVRTSSDNGAWRSENIFTACQPFNLAVDPSDSSRIIIATENGLMLSSDKGSSWKELGLQDTIVKSVAISPHDPKVIYAGTKPAYIYKSIDGGVTWEELKGFRRIPGRRFWFSPAEKPFKAYVQEISISPTDPNVLLAGIEFGAVILSTDGGLSWGSHRSRALRDCHSLTFHHSNGTYAYEGGGTGGGAAISRDGGRTWTRPAKNVRKGYGWAVAADPFEPETWFVSVASGPFKGHSLSGNAGAVLVRFKGDHGEVLTDGLPDPLPFMPYAIMPSNKEPGTIYVAMSNGDMWHSSNHGDSWLQLPVNAGEVLRTMVLAE